MARLLKGSRTISEGVSQTELDAFVGSTNITTLGTVTAGNLSNTAIVYPAGHMVKQSFLGNIDAVNIVTSSATYEDTAVEVTHVAALSSANSYLIFEWFCGQDYVETAGAEGQMDVTVRTVSNATYTVAESIVSGDQEAFYRQSPHGGSDVSGGNDYLPLSMRLFCGTGTGMGMPDTKSSWAAADTLYFRIFFKVVGGGTYRIAHHNTVWNATVTEVSK